MAKDYGQEAVTAMLRLKLSEFALVLHVRDTFTESDIDFVVEQLTTDDNYKWLKVADIDLLLKRIRMNRYGKLYQSMNTGTFFECLDKYCIERNAEIERLHTREAADRRKDMQGTTVLPYTVDGDGRIVVREPKAAPEPKKPKHNSKADRVAHMARMFVGEGMGYAEAIEKAAAMVENAEQ